jgi:hypothetical protein
MEAASFFQKLYTHLADYMVSRYQKTQRERMIKANEKGVTVKSADRMSDQLSPTLTGT